MIATMKWIYDPEFYNLSSSYSVLWQGCIAGTENTLIHWLYYGTTLQAPLINTTGSMNLWSYYITFSKPREQRKAQYQEESFPCTSQKLDIFKFCEGW